MNALLSMIDDGGFTVDGGCDADAGCLTLPAFPLTGLLVTYVRGPYDGGADPPGFFLQASPSGPAVFVEALDGGVTPGMMVSLTVLEARRSIFTTPPRQVTLWSDVVISSQGNPLGPWEQDISGVDFTQPAQLDLWESRLIRVQGTTMGGSASAGTGYSAISLATAGTPDAGGFGSVRLRLEAPLFTQQDLAAGCNVWVRGTPLMRFGTQPQPMAYRASELMGSFCPPPNLLSALPQSNTVLLATFDRNLAIPSAAAFTIDGGSGNNPSVLLATPVTPRQFALTTSSMNAQPYELICSPTMTDTRGSPIAQRTASFTGIAAGPASCSPVVISEIYPGGGNAGATLNVDYVELKNRSSQAVNLAGWTLAYQSAAGSTWISPLSLNATLQPGAVLVIQAGANPGSVGAPLTADLVWSQVLSASGAKLALVAGSAPMPGCPAPGTVADLVGYGALTTSCSEASPAPAPSGAQALSRINGRCEDTNVNITDFVLTSPNPRGSVTPCSLTCAADAG